MNQLQSVTESKGTLHTEEAESLQDAKVEKQGPPSGKRTTWPQGSVGGPMAKKSKAGGDLV